MKAERVKEGLVRRVKTRRERVKTGRERETRRLNRGLVREGQNNKRLNRNLKKCRQEERGQTKTYGVNI